MTAEFVINHLWQSSGIALLAGLLVFVLRKNSPRVRYRVWLSASLKFLVPLTLLVHLGGMIKWPAQRAISEAPLAFAGTLVQIAEPFTPPSYSAVPAHVPVHWVPIVISVLWALGLAAITFVRCRSWFRIRAALRASTPVELPIPIPAFIVPGAEEPGIVGFLRPVLVLPANLLERLNPRQLDAVLAHELCHVRRCDNLFAAIHMVVEAIFWFHPLVWWIGSRMVEERELACDEEVLRMGCEPTDYVEGILNVCRFYKESPLPCVSGVAGADVKKRLRAILAGSIARELNFGRKVALAVVGFAALAVPIVVGVMDAPLIHAQAQVPAATPKWEAVSIRPCEDPGPPAPGVRGGGMGVSPGRLHIRCFSVGTIVNAAYVTFGELNPNTAVSGGPGWIHSSQYNIEAKAEGNPGARTMEGPMLQALLEDRFKLKIRRETKEVPVYDLTVAKGGFKLQPMKDGSCITFDFLNTQTNAQNDLKATLADLAKSCDRGGFGPLSINLTRTAEFHGMTLDAVARHLSVAASGLGRPVVNKTGIEGVFDFQFEFSPDQVAGAPGDAPSDPTGAPSIFTAIQRAAGLKLEPSKGPGVSLFIDSIERPSEN
jgi:bla regulator protein BlaR1